MRLFKDDQLDRTIMTLIEYNMRTGKERIADIYAQHRSGKLIEARLVELIERYGLDTVDTLFEDIFDYTQQMFRKQVSELPNGKYEFEDYSDKDIMHPDGQRIACIVA